MVPDIDHAVEFVVPGVCRVDVEQVVPIVAQFGKSSIHLFAGVEACHHSLSLRLVDDLRSDEFLLLLVLDIAQQEDIVTAFIGLQFHLDVVRSDGAPTVGMAVARTAFDDGIRIGKLIIEADERLTVGVKALDRNVHTVECVVIAALAVFGLVVDNRALDFDLTGREVALEVLHVGRCIPQAPLGKGEQLEALHLIAVVGEREFLHLGACVQGHKE